MTALRHVAIGGTVLASLAGLCGCATVHRTEVPVTAGAHPEPSCPPDLSHFWLANGFERQERGCAGATPLIAPAQRSDVAQETVACWQHTYPGWLFFPASGSVFGREVVEGGSYAVYVYSIGRESEATHLAATLRSFLAVECPNVSILATDRRFVDFR